MEQTTEQTTQNPPAQNSPGNSPAAQPAGQPNSPSNSQPDQSGRPQPQPSTGRDLSNRPRRTASPAFRIAVIIGVVALLVVGFFVYRHLESYESTDDAQVDGHINSVSTRIAGHVISLNVNDNQNVPAGTVLVELDPADYQVAYESAKADFESAQAAAAAAGVNVPIESVSTTSQVSSSEADVAAARAAISSAKQQVESAKAQLAQAQANDVKAQNDLGRYKQLVDKQEISQQQYDVAVAAAKASTATVDSAKAQVDAAQDQVAQAQAKLAQSQAAYRNAQTGPQQIQVSRSRAASALADAQRKKAALDQAALNLQYTKITTPVAGLVSDRTVEVGQNVSPGQELMKIIPLNDIWITANFKETQLREMKIGQPVTIEVDANGRTYHGKVDSIAAASGARFSLLPPENATGNYVKVVQRIPVKIVLNPGQNDDQSLRPGMSVNPKVWIRQ